MSTKHFEIPTIFVILGATGDLMAKKIIPALYHLYHKQKLPSKIQIIGFSRRDWTNTEFQEHVHKALQSRKNLNITSQPHKKISSFLQLFTYHQGEFDVETDYTNLAKRLGRIDGEWNTCANKLFYLAVPPQHYETIFTHLASSGLTIPCGEDGGWTRVLVEKPFGKDCETAQHLDEHMSHLFKEEQIYRIDHYLAKEMLQNILTFRFSNNLLESSWNNNSIEKIEIKLYETQGVEERGNFYDGVGALRDVGQNHLLQMLSLVTMDNPMTFESSAVRKKRAELLQYLCTMQRQDVQNYTFRAQYHGYQDIPGVKENSQTETYFKLILDLDTPRWHGVPITVESGKCMDRQQKEIRVTFKPSATCLLCFPHVANGRNEVVFSLEPEEDIKIHFLAKKPGLEMELQEEYFHFAHQDRKHKNQYVEEYEKLLLDCIEGNQLLFVSTAEVNAMWQFIDPIVHAWEEKKTPLYTYTPNTAQVQDAAKQFFSKKQKGTPPLSNQIGIIGLGKMGGNIAYQLSEKGWDVHAYNRTYQVAQDLKKEGITPARTIQELVSRLHSPRVLWIMVPAGKPVDDTLFGENGLIQYLEEGDIIIDAGNSNYKDAPPRAHKLAERGVRFVDAGVSGGPGGARYGACIMVGGDRKDFQFLAPLFTDITVSQGVEFFPGVGAGHFVKMIHNGIEYGMMQAIAEGFAIMQKSPYALDLSKIASVYNHGSVIESRLIQWLYDAFHQHGQSLEKISGSVAHTGEGQWTVEAGKELGIPPKIIEESLQFRVESEESPSYTGKIVSALRNQFGGHKATT